MRERGWQLSRGLQFHISRWDNSVVLYEGASGSSSLLDPLSFEVFQLFQKADGPLTLSGIGATLSENGEAEDRDALRSDIQRIVYYLGRQEFLDQTR